MTGNVMGERIVGVEAVGESWRRIFSGDKHRQVQLSDINRFGDDRLITMTFMKIFSLAATGHRDKYLPFQWQWLTYGAAPRPTRNRYQH